MLMIENLQRMDLGIQGENKTRAIEINCQMWRELYPNGAISLYHQRMGETAPEVTGATYDAETGILRWEPTSYDTFYAGEGKAEIRITENGCIRKTTAIGTITHPATTGSGGGTIESNQQAYIDEIDRIRGLIAASAAEAQTAQSAAEDAKSDAEAWANGTRSGEPITEGDEAYQKSAKDWAEIAGNEAVDASESAVDAWNAATAAKKSQDAAEASEDAAAQSVTEASHWAEMALMGAETSGFAWFDIDDESGMMKVVVSARLNAVIKFQIEEETGMLQYTINE